MSGCDCAKHLSTKLDFVNAKSPSVITEVSLSAMVSTPSLVRAGVGANFHFNHEQATPKENEKRLIKQVALDVASTWLE